MKKGFILLALLIVLSGCKFSDLIKKKDKDKSDLDKEYNITVPVTVSKSLKTTLIKYIKSNGSAEALLQTDIIAQTSGTIDTIYIKENSPVKANTLILEIDKKNILLDIKQAKLEYNKAKSEYEAWKNVDNNLTDDQLKLQTGLIQKELQLNKLLINLEKASVKAPFSGIIYKMEVVPGEYVSAGQKLFSIINNKDMIIRVNVLESEIDRIKTNANVTIKFPAIQNKLYYGTVKSISPYVDKTIHSCEVIIKPVTDGKIKDGMYALVKIEAEKYPDKLLVYKDAILTRDDKKLLFTVEHNLAKWHYVKIGKQNEYFCEIISGLKPNQDVVIKGNFALSHDAKVKITKEIGYKELSEKF